MDRTRNLFDSPRRIANKITSRGLENPRLIKARTQEKFNKALWKDLAGQFKVWTPKEIAKEYTLERIDALLTKGNYNLMTMRAPKVSPAFLEDAALWVP